MPLLQLLVMEQLLNNADNEEGDKRELFAHHLKKKLNVMTTGQGSTGYNAMHEEIKYNYL